MEATYGDQVLPDVPSALFAKVLQWLPQQHRLQHCALVCTHWKAAADLATVSIEARNLKDDKLPALQSWIGQHAKQLVSIKVSHCSSEEQLQLPCTGLLQLTSLDLSGQFLLQEDLLSTPASAQAAAAPLAPAAAAGELLLRCSSSSASTQQLLLPQLQELQLSFCRVASTQLFLQLSRLTSLTKLDLHHVSVCAGPSQHPGLQEAQELSSALCALLPCLSKLQAANLNLTLPGTHLRSVVQQFSALQLLRDIAVGIDRDAARTDDLLSGLPSGLTRLRVDDMRWLNENDAVDWLSGPATFPAQLPQLSDLLDLDVRNAGFDPSLLSHMSRLQSLYLVECALLPGGDVAGRAAAAAAFLSAVGRMADLRVLAVKSDMWDHCAEWGLGTAPPTAYAALTASSKLQRLALEAWDEQPLPSGAVQHMFPQGRVLPHLTELALNGVTTDGEVIMGAQRRPGFMSAPELNALARACPNLVELGLFAAMTESDDGVTPLLQLPKSVTRLSVGGAAFDDAAAAVVAQLTQLRNLVWQVSPGLTDLGLQQLTALQQLDGLLIHDTGLSAGVLTTPVCLVMGRLELTAFPKEPIWQQLCERLDKSPVLAVERLEQHKQDKELLQQRIAQLEQQLAAAQQEIAVLQQQR